MSAAICDAAWMAVLLNCPDVFCRQTRFLYNWFAGRDIRHFSITLWFKALGDTGPVSGLVDNGDCVTEPGFNMHVEQGTVEGSVNTKTSGSTEVGNVAVSLALCDANFIVCSPLPVRGRCMMPEQDTLNSHWHISLPASPSLTPPACLPPSLSSHQHSHY